MQRYLGQRLALMIPSLVGLTIIIFFVIRVLIPVDAVDLASADTEIDDPELEAQLREELGISGPVVLQYVGWLGRMATGDLGESFYTKRPVTQELKDRIPVSLEVGGLALAITVVLAIPIGIFSAVKQDTAGDYLVRGSAIMFYAIPGFWVATLALVFGSRWFNWAPPIDYAHPWEDPIANLSQMAAPVLILGLSPIGTMTRLVRTQVLEVIRQDYVTTARAKGLGTRDLYGRHVLRNALLPIVTVIGFSLPGIVNGTVIFEQIFVLPGVGRYLLESVQRLDLYVIMATNVFFGLMIMVTTLLVDVSYAFIDPRVRISSD